MHLAYKEGASEKEEESYDYKMQRNSRRQGQGKRNAQLLLNS
jgi:hypothetical protein